MTLRRHSRRLLTALACLALPGTASAWPESGLDALLGPSGHAPGPADAEAHAAATNPAALHAGPGEIVRLTHRTRALRQVQAPALKPFAGAGTIHLNDGASFCGDFAFLRRDGQPGAMHVTRLSDGRSAGQVAGGEWVRCAEGAAFISTLRHPPAVVELASGELHRLPIALPDGGRLRDASVFPVTTQTAGSDEIVALVHVRSEAGGTWFGRWSPGGAQIALSPSPFSFVHSVQSFGAELQVVGAPLGDTQGHVTVRRYGPGGELDVLGHGAGFHVAMHGGVLAWSQDAVDRRFGVVWGDGTVDVPRLDGCIRAPFVYAASADGVLAGCQDRQEAYHNYAWFSPATGWRTLRHRPTYPLGSSTIHARLTGGRTTLYEFNQSDQPTGTWFDMRRGVFFEGTPLWGMRGWPTGQRERLLATNVRRVVGSQQHTIDVYHIDLARGVEEKVMTYSDCPGYLHLQDAQGGRFAVHCLVEPKADTFSFTYRWSEVIDVDAGTRWRETRRRIEGFTPDGRALVSNLGAGTSAIRTPPRRLWIE